MYKFSITKNANADHELFDYWMRASYPAYDGYAFREDDSYIMVYSSTEFTQNEKNDITAYYSALTVDDTIEDKYCRIYSHMAESVASTYDKTIPPFYVDYTLTLAPEIHPIYTSVYKGEIREIIYYESISMDANGQLVGTTPVVRESYTYVRDVAKMVVSRTGKIYWYKNDGTEHPEYREIVRYYAPYEKIVEGQELRKRLIDFCQPVVLGMIMATEQVPYNDAVSLGAQLSNTYSNEMNSWINASRDNALLDIVEQNTTIAWLDNVVDGQGHTIRDHILDQLNY